MNKKEKLKFIIETLEYLFPDPQIPLQHKDNFTLLIAVLLSAQCTDKRVNIVTSNLFEIADNPLDMSALPQEAIRKIIRSCGLSPAKSKAIKSLSKILVQLYNGKVPTTFMELEALPGVGHKTASVIMSQAMHKPAFPVDTHIHRLMYRWGLSNGKNVIQTEKDAKRLFPKEKWHDLHLQIIYYGREYSPARGASLTKDIITKTVGSKSEIRKLNK